MIFFLFLFPSKIFFVAFASSFLLPLLNKRGDTMSLMIEVDDADIDNATQLLWMAVMVNDISGIEKLATNERVDPNCSIKQNGWDPTPLAYACYVGATGAVAALLKFPTIDLQKCVGIMDAPHHHGLQTTHEWSPIKLAYNRGRLEIIELLLSDKRIDVNHVVNGQSLLFLACLTSDFEMTKKLLRIPEIDVNAISEDGSTALFMACQIGKADIMTLILTHPKTEPNKPMLDNQTPLSVLLEKNHSQALEAFLALADNVDTEALIDVEKGEEMGVPGDYNHTIKSLNKRFVLPREVGLVFGSHESVYVFDEFVNDRRSARARFLKHWKLYYVFSPRAFSLVVMLCDDYFTLTQLESPDISDIKRFFNIAKRLPIEMQMTLCNRIFGLSDDLITKAALEKALRHLAWRLHLENKL